ncbi:hypothetical protein VTK56DRAFT_2585 [Thermocarpiscus australiensis]
MFDSNPNLIQDSPAPGNKSLWSTENNTTPLVLIHDGGGTIFSYYCLGELGRPLFGIANPRFYSGGAWEGGIPQMARHYLDFIKSAVPRGNVIIGGWSLGGLLSLEVARLLADEINSEEDKALNLLGIVMVDSVCPLAPPRPPVVVQHAMQWSEHTKEATREQVTRCFAAATRMVKEWTLPEWEGRGAEREEKRDGKVVVANGNGHVAAPKTAPASLRPPPVILLRAMEAVPVPREGVSRVDLHRGDRLLGWGNYRRDLITKVMDIPGHHFNISHMENVDAVTEAIKEACLELEAMNSQRLFV